MFCFFSLSHCLGMRLTSVQITFSVSHIRKDGFGGSLFFMHYTENGLNCSIDQQCTLWETSESRTLILHKVTVHDKLSFICL